MVSPELRNSMVSPELELHMIQDPASKLHPKEEVSVVRYMVGQTDWKSAASE